MGPNGAVLLIILFTVGAPMMATVAIFAMRYGAMAFRARMQLAADGQYRALAQETAAAQTEMAASLAGVRAQLAAVAASLAAIEKVLHQVE
jgi:hypothetical protein